LRIISIKRLEECLDGVAVMDFFLDKVVDDKFIQYLGNMGKVEYFPEFPKPFYRITRGGQFVLKGVQGNNVCQIFYFHYLKETEKEIFNYIENYETLEEYSE